MLLSSYVKSFSETLLLPYTFNSCWGYRWKHFISVREQGWSLESRQTIILYKPFSNDEINLTQIYQQGSDYTTIQFNSCYYSPLVYQNACSRSYWFLGQEDILKYNIYFKSNYCENLTPSYLAFPFFLINLESTILITPLKSVLYMLQ